MPQNNNHRGKKGCQIKSGSRNALNGGDLKYSRGKKGKGQNDIIKIIKDILSPTIYN